ncbi:2006_t:CDS:2, partial [Cetraspora pellucida]
MIPGPMNSELCGSVSVELPYGLVNSELCSSVDVMNSEYNNSKLYSSGNVELSLDLEPGSVDVELPSNLVLGSVDVELLPNLVPSFINVESLPCLVNPEYNSTWSGFEDFELSGFKDFEINSVNRPKKVENIDEHHDSVSGKTDCPWLVHFYFGIRIHDESDTATMLQHLFNLKEQDQEYVVISCIEGKSNELTEATNNLFPVVLFSNEDPARYSILKVFTAGAESTQRVESINSVLKKHIDQDYYGSNLSSGLLSTYNTIFKAIYLVKESNIEVDHAIKHLYDVPQIQLSKLLLDISNEKIQEIWE